MYTIYTTNTFDKDVKLCIKRKLNITLLQNVMKLLEQNGTLPSQYKPHKLKGKYNGCWECHIKPDWFLIW